MLPVTLAADIDLPRHAAHAPAKEDTTAEFLLWLMPTILLALVLAIKVWGIAALSMVALALVPVMFAIIIWITLP
jgi:hypothetical protein